MIRARMKKAKIDRKVMLKIKEDLGVWTGRSSIIKGYVLEEFNLI
jgi:hypothetical protein